MLARRLLRYGPGFGWRGVPSLPGSRWRRRSRNLRRSFVDRGRAMAGR